MVSVTGEHSRTYPAWSGDAASLTRISRVMADAVADERANAVAEVTDRYPDSLAELRESALGSAVEAWTVSMSVEERRMNLIHSGSVDGILSSHDVDFSELRKVALSVGRRFEKHAEVVFDGRGATVSVKGSPGWMRSTSVLLGDELRRKVPWWGWLRTIPASALFTTLAYITFFTVTGWAIVDSDTKEHVSAGRAAVAYVNWAFIFIWPGIAWHALVRKLLPGVEVLIPPNTSRGGRAFAIIGTFLVSLAASLVANAL